MSLIIAVASSPQSTREASQLSSIKAGTDAAIQGVIRAAFNVWIINPEINPGFIALLQTEANKEGVALDYYSARHEKLSP